ncbi:MAG: flagellar biosynthesis protein FliQ [Thalassobaculum sp.]|uniref:flagellar biosynthesis protein FliQ n=1 Tax=Thalassobaculum sp. TaxID=2022740 RepID=UPI0032EC298E
MTEEDALSIARESILTLLAMAGPIMGVALVIGLIIALFQALTQLQEMTLVFVPKIAVVFASLLLLLPFMLAQISTFFESIADKIIGLP